MAEKASLYELLGLESGASGEDIQLAFETRRHELEQEPDLEHRRNRLSFIQYAYDVLSNPKSRMAYDQQNRAIETIRVYERPSSRALWPGIVLVAIVGVAYQAWQYSAASRSDMAVPSDRTTKVVQLYAVGQPRPVVSSEERPAFLQPSSASDLAKAPSPRPRKAEKVVFGGPLAADLAKFSDSTYVISGVGGLGTGVVVGPDRLLTNCHVIAPSVLKGPIFAINPATGVNTRITSAAFLIREDACVVHAPGLNGSSIAIGSSANLAVGARTLNIGFSNGRMGASAGELIGVRNHGGQSYLVTSNLCDQSAAGGPLVDDQGRLVGLISGSAPDSGFCLSLAVEIARTVLAQTLIAIDAFPPNYTSNLDRRE
ncbi:MAG: trypsin-like peptidase domain-containing protein [Sulfuritalea sp.]|nr:trypsin-like peptidase domain-containing protein [Sulfuritalea sp.]